MASTCPKQQLVLDFACEADVNEPALEPRGGQSCAAVTEKPALEFASEDLMEKVLDPDNLERAWKQVRGNRGAPGIDGMTLAEFPEYCREHWPEVRQQLLDGTYRPLPVRRKAIEKEGGGG